MNEIDLLSKIQRTEDCWLWTATINRDGYGRGWFDGTTHLAHRLVYMLAVGPIPDGYEIDHLCRVRNCVRPTHLEAVTPKVNLNRRPVVLQETCKRGHLLSGANLRFFTSHGRLQRRCRTCALAAERKSKAR